MIDESVLDAMETSQVIVNGVKVDLECPTCHRKWGCYLTEMGKLPYKWDWCIRCADERKADIVSRL